MIELLTNQNSSCMNARDLLPAVYQVLLCCSFRGVPHPVLAVGVTPHSVLTRGLSPSSPGWRGVLVGGTPILTWLGYLRQLDGSTPSPIGWMGVLLCQLDGGYPLKCEQTHTWENSTFHIPSDWIMNILP